MEDLLKNAIEIYMHSEECLKLENEIINVPIENNIENILRKKDSLAKYASVSNVMKYKNANFTSENLMIFYLCLKNLRSLITQDIIRIELKILLIKVNDTLFLITTHCSEIEKIRTILQMIIQYFEDLIENKDKIKKNINDILFKSMCITSINESLSELYTTKAEDLEDWKSDITMNFESMQDIVGQNKIVIINYT